MFGPLGAALVLLTIQTAFTAHLAPFMGARPTILSYAGCFLTYAAVLWLLRREESTLAAALTIGGVAFAIRAVLAFAEPTLSDDIFRYVWEGRVSLAGLNPFVHAPASEALAALRDEAIWPRVNHPEVPTIYPPVSQLFFATVALFGGGTTAMRLLFIAAELLGVVTLWRLAGDRPGRLFGLALYLLNPLVIMEVAWSGHLDVLAWMPLTAGLVILATRRGLAWNAAAGVLLGLSIASKLLALILLPYLLLRRRAPDTSLARAAKERALMLTTAAAVLVSSYAVYAGAGTQLFGGFGTYAASWRSNDGLFRAWESTTWIALQQGEHNERIFEFPEFDELALDHGFTKDWQGQTLPNTSFATNQISQTLAKALAALVVGIALLWCIVVVRDPVVAALVVLGTLYVVAPTVHPWYVAWLIPLTAFRPNTTSLAFSATVLAAYVAWISYANGGAWLIPWWVVTLEYSLVAVVLAWEVGRSPQEDTFNNS